MVYFATQIEAVVAEEVMVQLRENGTFLVNQEIKSNLKEGGQETSFTEIGVLE